MPSGRQTNEAAHGIEGQDDGSAFKNLEIQKIEGVNSQQGFPKGALYPGLDECLGLRDGRHRSIPSRFAWNSTKKETETKANTWYGTEAMEPFTSEALRAGCICRDGSLVECEREEPCVRGNKGRDDGEGAESR